MNKHKVCITSNNTIKNFKDLQPSVNPLCNIFRVLLMILLATLINPVNANELKAAVATISYGDLSETINEQMRSNIIKQNESIVFSDQIIGKATGKTRDKILKAQQTEKLNEISSQARSLTVSISSSYAPEFTIYNAYTTLHNDFDWDGYYQTFSVFFDADIYSYDSNDIGVVYARLYLSENGGPWLHYYTTDDFIIHGNSDQDVYEVITTLRDGYYPSHYDILIDLYQTGYNNIVATYSSDDSSALYALPLESIDYDQEYIASIYFHHAGSLSAWSLITLLLVLATRLTRGLRHPL